MLSSKIFLKESSHDQHTIQHKKKGLWHFTRFQYVYYKIFISHDICYYLPLLFWFVITFLIFSLFLILLIFSHISLFFFLFKLSFHKMNYLLQYYFKRIWTMQDTEPHIVNILKYHLHHQKFAPRSLMWWKQKQKKRNQAIKVYKMKIKMTRKLQSEFSFWETCFQIGSRVRSGNVNTWSHSGQITYFILCDNCGHIAQHI